MLDHKITLVEVARGVQDRPHPAHIDDDTCVQRLRSQPRTIAHTDGVGDVTDTRLL